MCDPNGIYVRLPLENAVNVRDLGGYPGHDGKPTRFKAFVRSGDLSGLTAKELQFLSDYGIRTVIDLRTDPELQRMANPYAKAEGVDFHHISFLKADVTNMNDEVDENDEDPMGTLYIKMFDKFHDAVISAVKTIAKAREGGVLFHCSAGKDRTGILAYILLSLAGVSERDIVANYRITDTYYIPYLKKVYDGFDSIPLKYLKSKASTIERTIKHITDTYGGVVPYLKKHGVTDEEMDAIRNRLL